MGTEHSVRQEYLPDFNGLELARELLCSSVMFTREARNELTQVAAAARDGFESAPVAARRAAPARAQLSTEQASAIARETVALFQLPDAHALAYSTALGAGPDPKLARTAAFRAVAQLPEATLSLYTEAAGEVLEATPSGRRERAETALWRMRIETPSLVLRLVDAQSTRMDLVDGLAEHFATLCSAAPSRQKQKPLRSRHALVGAFVAA